MFCVCDKSSAASTSSKIYMGAGEYCRRARMRERAIRDLFFESNLVWGEEVGKRREGDRTIKKGEKG